MVGHFLKFVHVTNYYIFIIIFFESLCMPLIATFLSSYLKLVHATNYYIFIIIKKHVVGRGEEKKTRTKLKFVYVKKTRASYVIQALELHGCTFPGSLLLHPDNNKWKHTMFTNKSCISGVHFVKTIYTGNLL